MKIKLYCKKIHFIIDKAAPSFQKKIDMQIQNTVSLVQYALVHSVEGLQIALER